mmetsp:Transcript_9558/g.26003  ORF Transcript_9558/g.26003 Transcript_9558/m.26003 type:complete len:342 (-) Transcript_9558:446-1471(-)
MAAQIRDQGSHLLPQLRRRWDYIRGCHAHLRDAARCDQMLHAGQPAKVQLHPQHLSNDLERGGIHGVMEGLGTHPDGVFIAGCHQIRRLRALQGYRIKRHVGGGCLQVPQPHLRFVRCCRGAACGCIHVSVGDGESQGADQSTGDLSSAVWPSPAGNVHESGRDKIPIRIVAGLVGKTDSLRDGQVRTVRSLRRRILHQHTDGAQRYVRQAHAACRHVLFGLCDWDRVRRHLPPGGHHGEPHGQVRAQGQDDDADRARGWIHKSADQRIGFALAYGRNVDRPSVVGIRHLQDYNGNGHDRWSKHRKAACSSCDIALMEIECASVHRIPVKAMRSSHHRPRC